MNIDETLSQIDDKIKELTNLKNDLVGGNQDSFSALKLGDIKSSPAEVVCKDFLPLIKGAYNVISGSGGVGKSTIALKSAMFYLRANPKDNALLVMGEDSKYEIEKRIQHIGKVDLMLSDSDVKSYLNRMFFITVDNDTPIRFLQKSNNTPVVNSSLVESFKTYLEENHIGFVVLDPLKKFHSCNENDNSEMDLLVRDVFLSVAGNLKVVMLVLHHSAKSLDARGARGASTITDTSRIAYKVAKKYTKNDSGEQVEDEAYFGKVMITTIKDNHNIFWEYGRKNTDNGVIELYKKENTVIEYMDEMPNFDSLPSI
jgi:RecA-family ATPase